jgi:hypothetical protein
MLGKREPLDPNSRGPILSPFPDPNDLPRLRPPATLLLSRNGDEAGTGLEAVFMDGNNNKTNTVTFSGSSFVRETEIFKGRVNKASSSWLKKRWKIAITKLKSFFWKGK